MILGLDYWNVISTHPDYFRQLARFHLDAGDEVHVISAIGPGRAGTTADEIKALGIPFTAVHEVVFDHPRESPWRKRDLAVRLGIGVFYDDRDDVCEEMASSGILALRVTRPFRRQPGGPRTARQASHGDRTRADIAAERR
jgi:acid phosphatase class B